VVTFVDCLNIKNFLGADKLALGEIAKKQISCADVIILNKTDLVTSEELLAVTDSVSSFNQTAQITPTSFSIADPNLLFSINAFSGGRQPWPKTPHSHYHGIDHILLTFPDSCFSPEQVTRAVGQILWSQTAGEVYRCKGLFSSGGNWFMLQGVGELFEVTPIQAASGPSKFLFIGTNLNRSAIHSLLS